MIVDLIITFLLGILNAVLGLIPEFTPWEFDGWSEWGLVHDAAQRLGGIFNVLDYYVPMRLLFGGLVAVLAARLFIAGVQFVRWVWDVLPFKST